MAAACLGASCCAHSALWLSHVLYDANTFLQYMGNRGIYIGSFPCVQSVDGGKHDYTLQVEVLAVE